MTTGRAFNKQTVFELVGRFIEGETLTIDEIMTDYLGEPRTELSRILWRKRAKGWIQSCKRRLKRNHEFLTVVQWTEDGKFFGIVRNASGAKMAYHQYYTLTKGILQSVAVLHRTVREKKLLTGQVRSTTLYLPKLQGEE